MCCNFINFRQKWPIVKEGVRGAVPCRVGRSPIRFFDLILNNALALRASQNRGKLPRGVCLCTTKSTKSTADGGEIARCVPLHHHRTTRRLWCEAFAPFRKPDAPNRTRPDASGRVRTQKMGSQPDASVVRPVSRTAVEKNAPA